MTSGYIYIRIHEDSDKHNVCKMGKTDNIPNRDHQYITNEYIRGIFIIVIEVDLMILDNLEKQLQKKFKQLHRQANGGTEFYHKTIIDLIIPYFIVNKIPHKLLSQDEIDNLVRKPKSNNTNINDDITDSINTIEDNLIDIETNDYNITQDYDVISNTDIYDNNTYNPNNNEININNNTYDSGDNEDNEEGSYTEDDDTEDTNDDNIISYNNEQTATVNYKPRKYQEEIIATSVKYFKNYEYGLLIIPCGVGKTLISLWICQKLYAKRILIGVPSRLLFDQWNRIVKSLFPDTPCLIVRGGISEEIIKGFLCNNEHKCIVITTYHSAHKILSVTDDTRFLFDIKILDEAHHLTSTNIKLSINGKTYIQTLNIPSVRQLSLTATIKQVEPNYDIGISDDNIISNDNVNIFGEIIDRKCLSWAIKENIICDYVIQTISINEQDLEAKLLQLNITEENDKRLFMAAYLALKSIFEKHSHHLLIYSNNRKSSSKLIKYIKTLLNNNYFNIPDLYYQEYHSQITLKDREDIINKFETSKFGIITCVYCLGEGWDCPLLDGVVFAENMSSNIRIVQSALRASRKNYLEPNKISKIILPVLNNANLRDEKADSNDLKNIRQVIYQMALEDEFVTQKVKVFDIEFKKHSTAMVDNKIVDIQNIDEYDADLTSALLKTVKRHELYLVNYEKAKQILAHKY
jgi:superfamily II DNA or RNA helicase